VADVPSDLAWRWQRTVSRLAAAQAGQTGGLGAVHTHVDLDWRWQRDASRPSRGASGPDRGIRGA
jgi:hypothetical protein